MASMTLCRCSAGGDPTVKWLSPSHSTSTNFTHSAMSLRQGKKKRQLKNLHTSHHPHHYHLANTSFHFAWAWKYLQFISFFLSFKNSDLHFWYYFWFLSRWWWDLIWRFTSHNHHHRIISPSDEMSIILKSFFFDLDHTNSLEYSVQMDTLLLHGRSPRPLSTSNIMY